MSPKVILDANSVNGMTA